MASHEYTRKWSGTVGRASAYGQKTLTIPAFAVPAGEKFSEFKCTSTGGLNLCGNMSSIGWNKWTTKKSYISWTDGSKSKVVVATSSDVNTSATVTVTFKTTDLTRYTLTCATSGSGTLTASTGTAYQGQSVTLTATPASGWKFVRYTTSNGGTFSGNTFTMPGAATTVTAVFERTTVNVTVASEDETKGTVTGSGLFSPGAVVNIIATPATGYVFTGWTTTGGTVANPAAESTTFTVPSAAATITAHFTQANSTVGRWNGESFEKCEVYCYDGTSFKLCEVKRYDGEAWIPCSNN